MVDLINIQKDFDRKFASTLFPINESYSLLPWNYIETEFGSKVPYYYLFCDDFPDLNLVARPPIPKFKPMRFNLVDSRRQGLDNYIQSLSKEISQNSSSLFDSVLVIYLDAVSRLKFHQFYRKTLKLLLSMIQGSHPTFTAVELKRLHCVGYNSAVNYPQFFAGFSTKYHVDAPRTNEPWLFDIAEYYQYESFATMSGCQNLCANKCFDRFQKADIYDAGGFYRQYMMENSNRFPATYNFPSSIYCESNYRPEIIKRSFSTYPKANEFYRERWIGNKLGMSYIFDWWRAWLISHHKKKRFATVIFEEPHILTHDENYDLELYKFLEDITNPNSNLPYHSEKMAILILADHGMHYTKESQSQTGKIANKQPFGFILLPHTYLQSNPKEFFNLKHNSQVLTTPYDLRATVQYWLTGRDFSSSLINKHDPKSQDYLKKVYASNYGENLLTQRLTINRSCEIAGIDPLFCACHLFPCEKNNRQLLKGQARKVADFINHRLLDEDNSPQIYQICYPLSGKEIVFLDDQENCLTDERNKMIINAYVTRLMRLISITFKLGDDGGGKVESNDEHEVKHPTSTSTSTSSSKRKSPQNNNNKKEKKILGIESLQMISTYAPDWQKCALLFDKHNISTRLSSNRQDCHCREEFSWSSQVGKMISAINNY